MTEREADIATTGFIMGLDVMCTALRDVQKMDGVPKSVSAFIDGFVERHENGMEKLARSIYQLMRKAPRPEKEKGYEKG